MVVWGGGRERRRELQCVGGCYCGGSTCIVCSVQSIEPHDQIRLAPPPLSASGATLLQDVSHSTLVSELCRARAEISIALDGSTVLLAECLMPLERLWPRNGLPDSIVVQTVLLTATPRWSAMMVADSVVPYTLRSRQQHLAISGHNFFCLSG